MTTTSKIKDLSEESTQEQFGEWLDETAPKNIGTDKPSIERMRGVIATAIERYPAATFKQIYLCLDNWWCLKCKPGFPSATLKEVLQKELDAAVLDGRHKPATLHEKLKLKDAAKRRRHEERIDNASLLRRIAEDLGCSTRYARMLVTERTTDRKKAEILARHLDTTPEEHFRKRRQTGPQPDLVNWFMKIRLPNSSFQNFIKEDGGLRRMPIETAELYETIRERVGDLKFEQAEIASLEKLLAYSQVILPRFPNADAATKIWRAYILWKIELVSMHAVRMTNEL